MDESSCDRFYDNIQSEIQSLQQKIKSSRTSLTVSDTENLSKQVQQWTNICSTLIRIRKLRKNKLDS
jgi:hypothetical protein